MGKIEYGMPTLIETDDIQGSVNLCKKLGLDFIEINMNLPQYQIENIDINKFKALSKQENIYFTIHLDENLNVCDFNKEVANAYIRTVLAAIKLAKELNIPVLNMHMANGVHFTLPDKKVFLFDQYKNIYLEKLKEFRVSCTKAIGNSAIKICIENCDGFKKFAMEGIELLLESPVFGLTFDIGHSHVVKDVDEAFINNNIDRLYHMHVHDANIKENHLPLGEGEIKIEERLSLAKEHNCRIVLETKTIEGLEKSVKKLKKYLFT